jgi:hypothetical protein
MFWVQRETQTEKPNYLYILNAYNGFLGEFLIQSQAFVYVNAKSTGFPKYETELARR